MIKLNGPFKSKTNRISPLACLDERILVISVFEKSMSENVGARLAFSKSTNIRLGFDNLDIYKESPLEIQTQNECVFESRKFLQE